MLEIDDRADIPDHERVLRAAAGLAGALTVAEIIDAIFEHTVAWLGGRTIGVWLLDDSEAVARFAGGAGYVPGTPEAVATIPVEGELPAALVIRTGEPVTYRSIEERTQRWPALASLDVRNEAAVVLKLDARGKRLGCLSIGFPERDFTPGQLATLGAVADQCALALDRALLYQAEQRANETLEFLAAGTSLMISALEPEDVVRRLVELAVPRLADSCAVFLARDGFLVRQAIAIRVQATVTAQLDDAGRIPLDADHALCRAFRLGKPEPISDPPGMAGAAGLEERLVRALAESGVRRGVAVPLEAGGETVGVMVVAWADRRGDTTHDRFALTGLAARAAIALTNARRFRRQLEIADMLAAAVLPAELPTPASIDLAARYIPAAGAVAGDWYDGFTRPDGQVVFGVGDALGHGLPAVAAMAELRSAARGLAVVGMSPAQILTHLSILVAMAKPDSGFATALYGALDPASGRGQWSIAGHPPPLLVAKDMEPRFLKGTSVPLGVLDTPGYTDYAFELPAGAVLVAVTDGVIERRGECLDEGLDRLRRAVLDVAARHADDIAEHLVGRFCLDPDDDCCVLVLRRRDAPR